MQVRKQIEREGRRMKIKIQLKMVIEDVRIAFNGGSCFLFMNFLKPLIWNILDKHFPSGTDYADAGIETPRILEPSSAALWELVDEEVNASPVLGNVDSGEEGAVRYEVNAQEGEEDEEKDKEGDEVNRIEESEDEDPGSVQERPSGKGEDGDYDEEYEEDKSWKEDSDDTGSRSLVSSSQDSSNESSDEESDFVVV